MTDTMLDILEMEDTEDGGMTITLEINRDLLEHIVSEWINNAIREKVYGILQSKDEASEMVGEARPFGESEEENTEYAEALAAELFRDETYDPDK